MKMRRKVGIAIIALLYLCVVFPPFMAVYNRRGDILGIPLFIVGILAISALSLLVIYILYRSEEEDK